MRDDGRVRLPSMEARYEWTRRNPFLAAVVLTAVIIGPMITIVFLSVRGNLVGNTVVSIIMFVGGVLIGWSMIRRFAPWDERGGRLRG
jgi:cytochrome c oxidase assembly factor CtaG